MTTSNNGNRTVYKYSRGKPRINSNKQLINIIYNKKR